MRHLWLLTLIVMGTFQWPVQAGETNEYDNDNEYDEDETPRPPDNLAKSTVAPKGMVPYFNQKEAVVYVLANASSVSLECPVKNLDVHHIVLWYQDESFIANSNQAFNHIYRLDSNYTLTMPLVNATGHIFSCRVMPEDVRRKVTIQIGTAPTTPQPAMKAANSSAPAALEVISLFSLLALSQGIYAI